MLTDWTLRLRSLFKRNAVERDLDEELRFHFEQQVTSYVSRGLSHDEAIRRARIEFGRFDQIREEHYDARGIRVVDDLGRDVRYAVRQLRRSPGFALAALLCLGIGIGATTTVYSVVDTVLLQPLPFPDSDRLVRVVEHFWTPAAGGRILRRGITYQELLDWRARSRTLAGAAAFSGLPQRLVRTGRGAVGLWGAAASDNLFTMMGVRALLGRTLVAGDDANADVVVLSFDTWQRHFNADPAVIGTALEFRAGATQGPIPVQLFTVVGVLPADFEFPTGPLDFYVPIVAPRSGRSPQVTMIGRLAPGVSLEAAVDEANAMGSAIRPPWPADAPALTVPRFEVQRLKDQTVQPLRPALGVLLAAVVVVLMIVCANVANLLLARGTVRRREVAVRLAIGAGRGRIVRQIMTECLVLAIAGGALGALVGAAGVALVKQLAMVEAPGIFRLMFGSTILPRAYEVEVDLKILGIAFSIAAVTSVVFGVLPALRLSRTNHVQALGSRGLGDGPAGSRIRAALVVGQLVMATTLLVGAGLLINSFVKLSAVESGYNPDNVLAFNLLFPDQYSIARKAETIEALLARFRRSPDVRSAGFARHGILIGEELVTDGLVPPGRSLDEMRGVRTRLRSVSSGYLTAMGVPLLDGREFEARDTAITPPALVMNRSAARQYFGTASPVGEVVDWYFEPGFAQPMTVVGVVEDVRQESPTDELAPEVFLEHRQYRLLLERWKAPPQRQDLLAIGFLSFALRTTGDPTAAVPVVREIVNEVDATIGIDAIVPMSRLVSNSIASQRFNAVMLGVFAGVAGVLAAIGIYGVLAYAVTQRTQEIGIRMALGAQRTQVLASVLCHGLILTAIGIALGLVGAAVTTRLLQGMLFGVTPLDPPTFVAVSLIFGLVATFASYVPARRATKVDPMVALRSE